MTNVKNSGLSNTQLEYSRRGSSTTLPINSAPQELRDLWNRGNAEGISMIKVRKFKERYETTDGRSFRVHNFGKIALNKVLPKRLRTGNSTDEVRFNENIKVGETNPTMTVLRVPSNYKSNPYFNRDIDSSFKAFSLDNNVVVNSQSKFTKLLNKVFS